MAPILDLRTRARIEAYLEADTRYAVAPIPTPVDVPTAIAVVTPRIHRMTEAQVIARISRLAVFHDLAPTAQAWEAMLTGAETDQDSVTTSAWAVVALAWLGDNAQRTKAARYFAGLVERADPEKSLGPMTEAALALGTDAELKVLSAWIERRATALEADAKRPQSGRPAGASEHLSIRADQLLQSVRTHIPRWRRTLEVRAQTLAMPLQPRIVRLANLYCELDEQSDTPLVWWSACTLVRIPYRLDKDGKRELDDPLRAAICDAFLDIAQAHDKQDPDPARQEELDMMRVRALHAAVYFGAVPIEEHRLWLYAQPEHGVDLLVLRPDFVYPGPHTHNAAPPP